MEDKNSFVFYETFLDFTDCLPEDERQPFIMSIIEYGIFGTVPEYSGAKKGLFLSIINAIDNSKERRRKSKLYGAMGGRTKKDSEKPMVNLKVSDENLKVKDKNLKVNTENLKVDDENLKVNLDVNVNENENENEKVNVNDKVNLKATTDGGDSFSILTSDIIHDHLQTMGYEVHLSSCGMIASILNKEKLPLEYCEFVENKVSDKYPEISAGLMVNALTTWIELFEEFRKSQKQKEKKKEKLLTHCVKCGSELGNLNWINGSNTAYFCCTCDSNFVRKNGEWREEKEL